MTRYLLDANIFIQSYKLHYGLDFCPAFWDWLHIQNEKGIVYSIDAVQNELQNPELKKWARKNPLFLSSNNPRTYAAKQELSDWMDNAIVSGIGYADNAKRIFGKSADYPLIAYALAHKYTVVSFEKLGNTPSKIQIPNACNGVGVKYSSIYEVLRKTNAKFILE